MKFLVPWRQNSLDGFEQRVKDLLDQRLLHITNLTAHIFEEAKCKIFNRVGEIEAKLPVEAKVLQAIAERETALVTRITNIENAFVQLTRGITSLCDQLNELHQELEKKRTAPPKPPTKKPIKKPSQSNIKPKEKATP